MIDSEMISEALHVLLVEDNPADVELIREAMEETQVAYRLHIMRDGEEAVDFLSRMPSKEDTFCPDLIILDLNLPKKDGREVLTEIKTNTTLRSIPVIVLTSSDAKTDIDGCYDLHCNAYIKKPMSYTGYRNIVDSLISFWFQTVELPASDR